MEIVVTGRNVEVPEHFRVHVAEKLARLERYDHKIVGMEVELFHEPNRRQSKSCQRIEITGRGCGPVARAGARAQDFYAALDAVVAKLESRLRRSHDRRRVTGRRAKDAAAGKAAVANGSVAVLERTTIGDATSAYSPADIDTDLGVDIPAPRSHGEQIDRGHDHHDHRHGNGHRMRDEHDLPGRVVQRTKHSARPMSLDEALSRMELVGHDFYLFADAEDGRPSVVYRRKGYDYGVIRLDG